MGYSPSGDAALTPPAGRATPAATKAVYSTEGSSRTGSPAARGPLRSALATCLRTGTSAPRGPARGTPHPDGPPRLSRSFTPAFTAPEGVRILKLGATGRALQAHPRDLFARCAAVTCRQVRRSHLSPSTPQSLIDGSRLRVVNARPPDPPPVPSPVRTRPRGRVRERASLARADVRAGTKNPSRISRVAGQARCHRLCGFQFFWTDARDAATVVLVVALAGFG